MYELFKLIRLNRDSKINEVDRIFFESKDITSFIQNFSNIHFND